MAEKPAMARTDDAQTTDLETPIKITWTGDARSKFKGRKVRARVADEGPHGEETLRTLDRLKTRVVVETREEAEALESMLALMTDADYTWTTENHRNAYRRVLSELRDAMGSREFDDEDDEDDTDDDDQEDRVETDGGDDVDMTDAAAEAESHTDAIPIGSLTGRDVAATDRETVTVTYDPYQETARVQTVTVDLSGHRTPTWGTEVGGDRQLRVTLNQNSSGIVSNTSSRIGRVRTVRVHDYSPAPKVERTYRVRVRTGNYSTHLADLPDRERESLESRAQNSGYDLHLETYEPVDRVYSNRETNGYEVDASVTFPIEADATDAEIVEAGRSLLPGLWSYDADDVEGTFHRDIHGDLKKDPLPETEPHTWVVSDGIDGSEWEGVLDRDE